MEKPETPQWQRPRYYKEANSQFLLPGGYSTSGAVLGAVLVVVGIGLGFLWLVPLGIILGIHLSKKVGTDEFYMKSVFRHLVTFKGMRYIVGSPVTPAPKVMVVRKGKAISVQEWVEDRS